MTLFPLAVISPFPNPTRRVNFVERCLAYQAGQPSRPAHVPKPVVNRVGEYGAAGHGPYLDRSAPPSMPHHEEGIDVQCHRAGGDEHHHEEAEPGQPHLGSVNMHQFTKDK